MMVDHPKRFATGAEIRHLARTGALTTQTSAMAVSHHQANLAIVPADYALEFMTFCHRNPKPCPLIDVTDPGDPEFRKSAPGSDVRTDVPRYCVYREGVLIDRPFDIKKYWRPDHVAFLLGCSLSADYALEAAGVEFGRIDTPSGRYGAYISTIECAPAGRLFGPMVVNARPVAARSVAKAVAVTARYPLAHGSPIHIGDPAAIGVDLAKPEWGQERVVTGDYIPVFWPCGVTPQVLAMQGRIPEMITHVATHMFVTDLLTADPINY